jgi:hypothetical protein
VLSVLSCLNEQIMFALAFDRRHNILLSRFSGVFNSSDIAELDTAIVRFTSDHGPAHGILDFSAVVAVSVPISRLLQRGRQPAISPTCKRIIVAKDPELFQLARSFTIQQGLAGSPEPIVVSSMEEALKALGAESAEFEPLARLSQL